MPAPSADSEQAPGCLLFSYFYLLFSVVKVDDEDYEWLSGYRNTDLHSFFTLFLSRRARSTAFRAKEYFRSTVGGSPVEITSRIQYRQLKSAGKFFCGSGLPERLYFWMEVIFY